MGKENCIAFPIKEEPKNITAMTLPELQAHYAAIQKKLHELDDREPEDMQSELYEEWADAHEALEDDLDEILDRMEQLHS